MVRSNRRRSDPIIGASIVDAVSSNRIASTCEACQCHAVSSTVPFFKHTGEICTEHKAAEMKPSTISWDVRMSTRLLRTHVGRDRGTFGSESARYFLPLEEGTRIADR